MLALLGRRIKAIPYMLRDKSVPIGKKALIALGVGFLFLPVPILPQVLFPFVMLLIIWYLRNELDKYWIGEKQQDFSRKFRNKTVIHGVDYEIKDQKDEK